MPTKTYKIAVFASGSGSNAEAIFKHFKQHPAIEVVFLLSNNKEAFALKRAENFNVPSEVFNREQFKNSKEVLSWLQEREVTHIVLAGFLWLIPQYLIDAFPHKIINIHPALLPRYGGKGMYGMKVHEAVKAAGELETGISIHEVNDKYDEGKILFQTSCPVLPTDTAEDIANRIHTLEHKHYPIIIERWITGELK